MPKRSCPFETQILRQRKTHVNDYENDLKALKNIQERTVMKLLEGSKNLNSSGFNGSGFLRDKIETRMSFDRNRNFKQETVTKYFTSNGKSNVHNFQNNKVINSPKLQNRCFFCDRGTNSTYQCIHCLEFYCSACSFSNYDNFEDKRTCISCS